MTYIETLERALGRTTEKVMKPMQDGDVQDTYADTSRLRDAVGFVPATTLEVGLGRFAEWFRAYYPTA